MLISTRGPRDWRLFFANDLVITLNGVVVENVVEADDEAGYIVRHCLDENGKSIREGLFLRLKTERVEGTVVFTGTKRYNPDDIKRDAEAKRARRQARNLTIANRAAVREAGAE